ncbi:MAG TPA: secretin N-terminal domain-containing protein [Burkholderiaceae bacterium]|nr:secretin N-terminal domain-containing protein [Burkholderiaceae bacterium]
MNLLRRRAVFALTMLATGHALAQDGQVVVLRYRDAEDVIPMLRPYLDSAGRLTGAGDRLYVHTTPQNLAQLRRLLTMLDRPPRWLTIAVRQDRPPVAPDPARAPNAAVVTDSRSASTSAGNDGSRITSARSSEQTVRVLEGTRTLIEFEAAVPMTFRHFALNKQGLEEIYGMVTYDALVRFVVHPQLAGTAVVLEIEPQDGSILTETGERGRLSMIARGRVGDWIPVGGADLREETHEQTLRAGTAQAQTRPTTDQRGVWLKVEFADDGTR